MLFNALILALREIRRNVLRSALTMLGIIIGVASVIVMVMLGDGATAQVTSGISKLGTNMLNISPGQEQRGPQIAQNQAKPFSMGDVEAIKRDIGGIVAVAPVSASNVRAIYGNENLGTTLYGTDNAYFTVRAWTFAEGREFTQNELSSGKSVCVIGETIRKTLFGAQSPIGKQIRVGAISVEVIGLLKSKGSSSFGMDQDELIVTPLKMLQRRITGNQDVSSITISTQDGVSTQTIINDLRILLRERRALTGSEEDNFFVRDMKDIIEALSSTTKTLTFLLGAVAAISLIVGGIGIMNIMLVSVTERTREIGIRLAIGALEREVLLQFLVEAVVLSSLGGLIGIMLGISLTYFLTQQFDIPFLFNSFIVGVSFLFSTFIGIVFGYFPAKKAATMNPIDALRHE